jgi:hypothetical protein
MPPAGGRLASVQQHASSYHPVVPSPLRFPPPWSVEERAAAFAVCDANGQALAYVYFEDEPGRRSAAKLLSKDQARRIAVNIAKLPQLLQGGPLKALAPEQRAEPQRGGVENWLAEKHAEEAASQRWTLGWAFLAALAAASVIVGAISIWLAK